MISGLYVVLIIFLTIIALVNWKFALLVFPFVVWKTRQETRKSQHEGYVYFLADQDVNRVKIGRTKNHPRFRTKRLEGQSPRPLKLLYFYHTDNMYVEEVLLHEKFADCRRHGEWFDLECVREKVFGEPSEEWKATS